MKTSKNFLCSFFSVEKWRPPRRHPDVAATVSKVLRPSVLGFPRLQDVNRNPHRHNTFRQLLHPHGMVLLPLEPRCNHVRSLPRHRGHHHLVSQLPKGKMVATTLYSKICIAFQLPLVAGGSIRLQDHYIPLSDALGGQRSHDQHNWRRGARRRDPLRHRRRRVRRPRRRLRRLLRRPEAVLRRRRGARRQDGRHPVDAVVQARGLRPHLPGRSQ